MKDKNVAAILALLLGSLGVHKFYLGRIGPGLLYLLFSFTFIPALLGLLDFFVLALMDNDEFNRRFNGANTLPGQVPVVVNMLPPQGGYPGYGTPYGYPPQGGGYPGQPSYGQHGYHAQGGGYPTAPASSGASADELKAQLEKLNELRISGLLTEDEFQAQKRKVLGLD